MSADPQTPDVRNIVAGFEALNEWLCTHPVPRERPGSMTFRQFHELADAKAKELGVAAEDVAPVRDHPDVQYQTMEIGMSYEAIRILAAEHHMDLPMDFRTKPEYQAMLEEEIAWEDDHPDASWEETEAALHAIVAKHSRS